MPLDIALVNWLKAPRDFLSLSFSLSFSLLADVYNNIANHYFHIWEMSLLVYIEVILIFNPLPFSYDESHLCIIYMY